MSLMLSIVIVNWNTRDLLARCLRSVEQSLGSRANPANETIVVDNGSKDGSVDLVSDEFPWARLIENRENVGFARACNQAMRQSKSRYVALLNSDTEVLPGAFDAMTQFMEAHPKAGACGPRLLNEGGTLQPSCYRMLTPTRELWRLLFLDRIARKATYPMHTWDTDTPRPVEVINGACLMLRRTSLDAVGLLDEDYFLYTEEVDLCLRLADAGWELWWIPQARVVHQGGASSRQVREAAFLQLYRSKVQFYRKFGGEGRASEFKRYIRIAYWLRVTVSYLLTPLSATFRGRARLYRRLLSEISEM
jgi:GT2 family glycosyltransferase